jgi:hypothetical protein
MTRPAMPVFLCGVFTLFAWSAVLQAAPARRKPAPPARRKPAPAAKKSPVKSARRVVKAAPKPPARGPARPGARPRPVALRPAAAATRSVAGPGGWRTELADVLVPGTPAAGKLQGESFYPDRTEFWNRGLVLSEGRGLVPARDVRIQIPLRNGEVPDGKSYDVRPRSGPGSPLIYMSRKPPSARKRLTQVVMKGYSMRLVFGRRQNGRLPGRLYLCLPDGQRSYVAGTFNAAIH